MQSFILSEESPAIAEQPINGDKRKDAGEYQVQREEDGVPAANVNNSKPNGERALAGNSPMDATNDNVATEKEAKNPAVESEKVDDKSIQGPSAVASGSKGVDAGENRTVKTDGISKPEQRKKLDGGVAKGGPVVNTASASAAANRKTGGGGEDRFDPESEAPLDLAAMSKFEYEQVARLNPAQLQRYEQYRRSDLKNIKVKRLLVALNPLLAKSSDQYVISVKGLAKLFVGDIVENAIQVKNSLGDQGALRPKHLREAYRRLRKAGAVPGSGDKNASI